MCLPGLFHSGKVKTVQWSYSLTRIRMQIGIDLDKCHGCRTCELACSYHFHELFNPELSSIRVFRDSKNGEVILSISSTCDYCGNCVEYCSFGALALTRDGEGS